MNPNLKVQEQVPHEIIHDAPEKFAVLFNFLQLVQADPALALKFSKTFKIDEFRLGDELCNYTISPSPENFVQREQKSNCLFVVCQGRVRLVNFDVNKQREVSIGVLEPGGIFGVENLFCNQTLPYKAIAASAGQVAWISITDLKHWLEHLPSLQDYLHQQAKQRQCLTFFKTTALVHEYEKC